jgi:cytochrome c biogenesis protein CcmG/thiol:disulfide interchange protein DsbE
VKRRLAVGVLGLGAGVVAAGLLIPAKGDRQATASGGSSLPAAPELTGGVLVPPPVRLAELRGRPVFVNFWASWCVPCRKEAPVLARFDSALGGRAKLVGVAYQDSERDARAFVRKYGWRFPNLRDANGELARSYRLAGLPTTVVIDREGRVAKQLAGEQTFASLRTALEEVE